MPLCRLLRASVDRATWHCMDDLCSDSVSQVSAYGGLSSTWVNPSLGQGRVLPPLLFHVVVNGAAAAAKRACPGVSLGPEAGAPRVNVLLYAYDIVIIAGSALELQTGLDALAEWARRWRFSSSPGVEKSAVMVVNGLRRPEGPFTLGCVALSLVEQYPYLGVVFQHKGRYRCALQGMEKGFVPGAVACLVGHVALPMQPFLVTLAGSTDAEALTLSRAAGLFGRLRSRQLAGYRSELLGFMGRRLIWSCWCPCVAGVECGMWDLVRPRSCHAANDVVEPALACASQRRFLEAARSLDSLRAYLAVHTLPLLHTAIHNRRVSAADAREWGLARCGHHVFADGRVSRHSVSDMRCFFCDGPICSLNHVLVLCPATADLRSAWCRRVGAFETDAAHRTLQRWVFGPGDDANSPANAAAHVAFVARACPGVSLGPEAGAPCVNILLYAYDTVIIAGSALELQTGLDALAEWARRWRFSFSPGVEKSAVMVVNGLRWPEGPFTLGCVALSLVEQYPYLGVVFQHKGRWSSHVEHVSLRGDRRFAECAAWALRESLDSSWYDKLFRMCVLPAFLHGCELAAPDRCALQVMDKRLRTWGRRFLGWPRGAPNAAVLGDLGWLDAEALTLSRAAGLFGRLRSRQLAGYRSEVPAVVFQYALTRGSSWASLAAASLGAAGALASQVWNVGLGAPPLVSRRWRRDAVEPALACASQRRFPEAARSLDSLRAYLAVQPLLLLHTAIHNRRVPAADAREWGFARCGHHVFADGRVSRHSVSDMRCFFCDGLICSLNHVLVLCPATADLRSAWCRRVGAFETDAAHRMLQRWVFDLGHDANSPANAAAHVAFVAVAYRRGVLASRDARADRPAGSGTLYKDKEADVQFSDRVEAQDMLAVLEMELAALRAKAQEDLSEVLHDLDKGLARILPEFYLRSLDSSQSTSTAETDPKKKVSFGSPGVVLTEEVINSSDSSAAVGCGVCMATPGTADVDIVGVESLSI
ncbi:unnamed protein product [Polarella glacialis]|uniref:Reverse transcriptase domain-containing protein n=2 Tax=Polarella glacialis TaxID=89957 RepID=A0A813H6K2_POLGL|nr:unnamed protein product [Polarella glacialis]